MTTKEERLVKTSIFLLLSFLIYTNGVNAKERYAQEVVCQFSSKDLQPNDLSTLNFDYDVDGNENLFYKDRKQNVIKVFDKSGKLISSFSPDNDVLLRPYNARILARDGKILIYSGRVGFLCDADGKNGKVFKFGQTASHIKLIDGNVFDYEKGKLLNSKNNTSSGKQYRYFEELGKYGEAGVLVTKDGSGRSDQKYEGYSFWNLKTIDEFGNVFAYYAIPIFPPGKSRTPQNAVYKFKLIKFNKNFEVQYVWDDGDYRVNEKTSDVYQLKQSENGIFQLIVWRKSN